MWSPRLICYGRKNNIVQTPGGLQFEGKFPGNYFEKFKDEKFCKMWKKEAY